MAEPGSNPFKILVIVTTENGIGIATTSLDFQYMESAEKAFYELQGSDNVRVIRAYNVEREEKANVKR